MGEQCRHPAVGSVELDCENFGAFYSYRIGTDPRLRDLRRVRALAAQPTESDVVCGDTCAIPIASVLSQS